MKKKIALLLTLALLLTGCGAQTKNEAKAESPAQPSATTLPGETEATPEPTDQTKPAVPETTAPSEPVEEAPVTPEPETTEPTASEEKEESQAPEAVVEVAPKQEESKPQETKPQETKPQESKPQETKPQQSTPEAKPQQTPSSSVPGRKVSSATCKDTGSDQVWEDPDAGTPDPYEESDPERVEYREYLREKGNEYLYWVQEDCMLMHVGRTYGMPLYTGLELMEGTVWTSSDPTVATVNEYGFVTALKAGDTVISASYEGPWAEGRCLGECEVTVRGETDYTYARLEQRAHEEAKKIADYAMENGTTDLERIGIAASLINIYVAENNGGSRYAIVDGELTTVQVPGYNQPFGTLVTFYSTCAGDTRAMGLVLEYMGFEWYHVNEGQWDHQWCIVYDVDGQTAFADGSCLGIVGYGERKEDQSNWQKYRNGALQPLR